MRETATHGRRSGGFLHARFLAVIVLAGTTCAARVNETAELLPSDGATLDLFGESVGISGTTCIVGATGDDDNGASSGSAYLFDATTGAQIDKLLPTDGTAEDLFGVVAIADSTCVVGARLDDDNGIDSGSAYLFDATTGSQLAKLLPSDGAAGDRFGSSVAIDGTKCIVGAIFDDDNGTDSGSAYLFDTTTGAQIVKLLPTDGAAGDAFGSRVAISGNTAIVGAIGDDDNGTESGSAYLFDATTGAQTAKLMPGDVSQSQSFGAAVAISGGRALVGDGFDDVNGANSGAAYVFDASPLVFSQTCFGSGCPCGNDDLRAGCANSTGHGGLLTASGSASVTCDNLVLSASQLPPGNNGLLYMGDALIDSPFYDGKQCVLGNTFRFLDSIQSSGATGTMSYTGVVVNSGSLVQAGETWYFHFWHRDVSPLGPCGTGANLTNAVGVPFTP